MFVNIRGGLYSSDIIAFVRKLNQKTKPRRTEEGEVTGGGNEYVVQLKDGYYLDSVGKIRTIFLFKEEGEELIKKLEEKEGNNGVNE